MEECTHDCSNCSQNCSEREPESFLAELNANSTVRKVVGVVSGKGGVGKSLVTSLLAVGASKSGKHTAILDADITGPSIPKSFGIKERASGTETMLFPCETKNGIKVMSLNLLTESETDPVVWRGPILAGMVKQFWTDVLWEDVDIMFIDMPPGTGDVPLTVFQSIPLDGILIVTSPQELVGMIVEKAVNMAKMMNIPVLGMVENMSYLTCPKCGEKIYPYGESRIEKTAEENGIDCIARIPIDPQLSALCDEGRIEEFEGDFLKPILDKLV